MNNKQSIRQARSIKYVSLFTIILMIITVAASTLIVAWTITSSDVLTIKNNPPKATIHDTCAPVLKGKCVTAEIDYCKNIKATGRVRISYISQSREVFLPISTDAQDPACRKVQVPVPLPKDLPPDRYRINFRIVYKINPIKNMQVEEFKTQPFEVR